MLADPSKTGKMPRNCWSTPPSLIDSSGSRGHPPAGSSTGLCTQPLLAWCGPNFCTGGTFAEHSQHPPSRPRTCLQSRYQNGQLWLSWMATCWRASWSFWRRFAFQGQRALRSSRLRRCPWKVSQFFGFNFYFLTLQFSSFYLFLKMLIWGAKLFAASSPSSPEAGRGPSSRLESTRDSRL